MIVHGIGLKPPGVSSASTLLRRGCRRAYSFRNRGRTNRGVVVACVYMACRQCVVLRTLGDVAGILDHVRFLEIPEPSLGEAIKLGVSEARHDKVVYFPMDLSADLGFIPLSVKRLDEFDLVVGSKRMAPGLDCRPLGRRLLSGGFHGLVRGLFGAGFTDTTCVKAFRRGRVLPVFGEVPSSTVFETEMLLAARRRGLRIMEMPVEVNGGRPSRQPLGAKVFSKLRALVSLRLDALAFWFGGLVVVSGLGLLGCLSLEKLSSGQPGFLNPYSFLLAMLLVVSGFQIIVFGLLASLLLQVRRTVEAGLSTRRGAEGSGEG